MPIDEPNTTSYSTPGITEVIESSGVQSPQPQLTPTPPEPQTNKTPPETAKPIVEVYSFGDKLAGDELKELWKTTGMQQHSSPEALQAALLSKLPEALRNNTRMVIHARQHYMSCNLIVNDATGKQIGVVDFSIMQLETNSYRPREAPYIDLNVVTNSVRI